MVDLIFVSNLFNAEKLKDGLENAFLVERTKVNFNNLKTLPGLADLMKAAI